MDEYQEVELYFKVKVRLRTDKDPVESAIMLWNEYDLLSTIDHDDIFLVDAKLVEGIGEPDLNEHVRKTL